MNINELYKCVVLELDSRNLKCKAIYNALDNVVAFVIQQYNGELSCLEKDKNSFKQEYERYKGCKINSAESSAINELYNQFNIHKKGFDESKMNLKSDVSGNDLEKNILQCLEPVVDDESKILILGSMPGEESLKKGEYYARSNNAMWRIIADLFNNGRRFVSYEEKVRCLHENHIAMWDTMKTCLRERSSDSTITDVVPNDIKGFIEKHPIIVRVIANGGMAAMNMPKGVVFVKARSTSGEYRVKYEKKLEEWRKLLTE